MKKTKKEKLENFKNEFYLLHIMTDFFKNELLQKNATNEEFEQLAIFLKDEINDLCKKLQTLKIENALGEVNFYDVFELYQELVILSNENFNRKKEKSVFFNCFNESSKIKTLKYYNSAIKIENNKNLLAHIKSFYKNDVDFFIHLIEINELKTQLFFQHVFKYTYNFKMILFYMIDNLNVKDKIKLKLKISDCLDRQFHNVCFYKINKMGVNI